MRKGHGLNKTWTLQPLVRGGLDQTLMPCAVQILFCFTCATMTRKFGSTELEDQTVVNISPPLLLPPCTLAKGQEQTLKSSWGWCAPGQTPQTPHTHTFWACFHLGETIQKLLK